MKKFLLLFAMCTGLMFAQRPVTVFGDLNVGTHFNPGIGVSTPIAEKTSLSAEVNRSAAATAVTFGVSQKVLKINQDSVSLGFDMGPVRAAGQNHFATEYSVGYNHPVKDQWSVTPYLKFTQCNGSGAWSGGLAVNFNWFK